MEAFLESKKTKNSRKLTKVDKTYKNQEVPL